MNYLSHLFLTTYLINHAIYNGLQLMSYTCTPAREEIELYIPMLCIKTLYLHIHNRHDG